MQYLRSSLRYAHSNGHTGLAYTCDGNYIITCGSDGDIRRWTCISDDDPTSTCLGEFVMCIAHKGERLLASTDRNTVQAYTFPAMDNDGTLFRFTAPATCLCARGKYIAAGSEDTKIKILNDEDSSAQIIELEGHTGPVLALDVCASKNLLASIGGDGQLKIWDLQQTDGKELKSISGLTKVNSFENAKCFGTPNFEPTKGQELAYVHEKQLIVLDTSTWEVKYTLEDEQLSSNFTCCQYSPNGEKIAAGTRSGEISIFDVNRRKTIKVEAPTSECKGITCIAWNSGNDVDELAYCDETGQLGTIYHDEKAGLGSGAAADMEQDELLGNDFGDIEFEQDEIGADDLLDGEAKDDDDDDADCVSIEKLKNKIMNNAAAYSNGDIDTPYPADDEDTKHSVQSSVIAPTTKTFKQQTAFQPSATPIDLEHRYLVWNHVGIVTAHTDGNGDGSIDVEFNDTNVHHSLHITNYQQHNMASLSTTALALAATDTSKLVVIALAASGNKEWSISLPDCETVEAVAATSKLVAVATSMYFLRLFTVMGTQREIVTIPGPIVALTGHEHNLLVVYHSAPSSIDQQYLSAMFIQTSGLTLRVQHIPIPLTPKRQLTWLGFSDCGSPTFADSMGLIQLYRLRSQAWFPICDTMKLSSSISNNFFIISILERSQIVQAVLCRATPYPMTNPRPMLQELPMQLPLCDIEMEKSELEDALVRASCMQIDGSEKMIKETAIKLFALSCRSECETRAKELIETISCTELLQLAVKYASKLGRIHLSDRLCELMPTIEAEQEARKQQDMFCANGVQVAPIYLPLTPTTSHAAMKLAPKTIDLTSAKRNALKRITQSPANNGANLFKSALSSPLATTVTTAEPPLDTQENIFGTESQTETPIIPTTKTGEQSRTPLNSVNPFVMKRKLLDTGVIFGSEKLKLAKK